MKSTLALAVIITILLVGINSFNNLRQDTQLRGLVAAQGNLAQFHENDVHLQALELEALRQAVHLNAQHVAALEAERTALRDRVEALEEDMRLLQVADEAIILGVAQLRYAKQ